jgi:membrane fusion protein, multidrug efflux system
MEDTKYLVITEELQHLRDEQQRLRDEQERLRRQQTPATNGYGNGNGAHKDAAHEKDLGKSGEGEKSDEGKETNERKTDDKNKEGEENKPKTPLGQRARTFANAHPKAILFGAIGFVVVCILVFFLIRYLNSYESTDDAEVDGHLNAVSSRISGTVMKVYIEDNQSVAAGQLLVELDRRDYQTMLDQAKANFAAAQADIEEENPNVPITQTANQTTIVSGNADVQAAQSGVVGSEHQYQAKLADLRKAEANNLRAQTDVLRYRPLALKDEISKQQFDSVLAEAKAQAAGVEAAQASAEAAQKTIDQSRDKLQQANTRLQQANEDAPRNVAIRRATVQSKEAKLKSAQAQVEQAALNLSYTTIYAPVAGIVGQKSVEIGQRVETGQQLISISQTEDIWVTANFKETQLRKMRPGQAVDFNVDAFGKKYHGYVASMPGATGAITSLLPPENATGNYVKVVQRLPVRIRLKQDEDGDHILRPGMSVEPKVWLK